MTVDSNKIEMGCVDYMNCILTISPPDANLMN